MKKKLCILIICLFTSLWSNSQELVKGITYSTSITGSGIIQGGTTYFTKIVITSLEDDIQLYDIVDENSPFFEKLKLDSNDTLTITYKTYQPHLSYPGGISDVDTVLPKPEYSRKGHQKSISFPYHPPKYGYLRIGADSLKITYKYKENIYNVNLPEESVKEIMRP